jgi:predicted methyltransferase
MKPGGILGVVDHIANPGGDTTADAFDLHRIDPERVKSDMEAACFDLAGSSDLLRNPADDHSTSATEGPMQGKTDRFLYRFVRR